MSYRNSLSYINYDFKCITHHINKLINTDRYIYNIYMYSTELLPVSFLRTQDTISFRDLNKGLSIRLCRPPCELNIYKNKV